MALKPRLLCIHGHFYQPPREDPWLGRILIEPSAAPMRHWNERIVGESYGPMGWAHRMDADGKIVEICNCYEWISFNVGPTLMAWLERRKPETYARVLEADAASVARWGHGNAIAQIYHHIIMPLASRRDKELETAWAVADFEARFKRKPEGAWLSETAVDGETLDVLLDAGIDFVILSPHQAKAVAGPGGAYAAVSGGNFDVTRPYLAQAPSGRSIAVFFYHAPLSQAVAFERLLDNGENFWRRINACASGGLLTLATDGETYGHHFRFGEMALAYVLAQARANREGLGLTNLAAYLAAHPAADRVLLHEPSAWSCAHGVGRWRSDCGCATGGGENWNQKWRAPLRQALDDAKKALDAHFLKTGASCFVDPEKALLDYGLVLADSGKEAAFVEKHVAGSGPEQQKRINLAWKLLAMQEQALAAFASCAWFFDEISRIEPVNAMTFMWRAMELAVESGGPDLREAFKKTLARAVSNIPQEGTGADILEKRVLPKQQDKASLCLLALLLLDIDEALPVPGEEKEFVWPAFSVRLQIASRQPGDIQVVSGTAKIGTRLEKDGEPLAWTWLVPCRDQGAASCSALDASSLTLTLPDGEALTRNFADMPRHVRDYVALRHVETLQKHVDARAESAACHVLFLMDRWEEGQTSVPYVWQWTAIAPYFLAACVTGGAVPDEKRQQAAAFCRSIGIPPVMREQAARMVEQAMLKKLAGASPNWLRLAEWVERAKVFLPEINLWAVRNAFWRLRSDDPHKRFLGEVLGFKMD